MAVPRIWLMARADTSLSLGPGVVNCSMLAPLVRIPVLLTPTTVTLYCGKQKGKHACYKHQTLHESIHECFITTLAPFQALVA